MPPFDGVPPQIQQQENNQARTPQHSGRNFDITFQPKDHESEKIKRIEVQIKNEDVTSWRASVAIASYFSLPEHKDEYDQLCHSSRFHGVIDFTKQKSSLEEKKRQISKQPLSKILRAFIPRKSNDISLHEVSRDVLPEQISYHASLVAHFLENHPSIREAIEESYKVTIGKASFEFDTYTDRRAGGYAV